MDIDKLFSEEMPLWWQQFVAEKDHLITIALGSYSELYVKHCKQKELIYEQYPRLAKFIDNDAMEEEITMSMEEAKALARLVHLEFDIMEMYQLAYLAVGLADGYELKEFVIKLKNEGWMKK